MNHFLVTVEYSYPVSDETLLSDYGTLDLNEAAAIDADNLHAGDILAEDMANPELHKQISVRPIKEHS